MHIATKGSKIDISSEKKTEEIAKKINSEIKPGNIKAGIIRADYVLVYKNRKLAVIEAKRDELPVSDGVSQAKDYAQKLKIHTTYSTNGHKIYEINYSKNDKGEMFITSEGEVDKFPSPEELWIKTFKDKNEWSSKFDAINYAPFKRNIEPRYYQEIAINNDIYYFHQCIDIFLLLSYLIF